MIKNSLWFLPFLLLFFYLFLEYLTHHTALTLLILREHLHVPIIIHILSPPICAHAFSSPVSIVHSVTSPQPFIAQHCTFLAFSVDHTLISCCHYIKKLRIHSDGFAAVCQTELCPNSFTNFCQPTGLYVHSFFLSSAYVLFSMLVCLANNSDHTLLFQVLQLCWLIMQQAFHDSSRCTNDSLFPNLEKGLV